ncbi:DUF4893 domain-containing protein [Sphingomonas donggukensis]|uniref:DUF4893 domain-containing protein n=1 Tax=Sphingomonas donggukensis TaxID=2949093 RepID=A0ABY4TTM1_9SPHN|nr:DUF4893 domain-containing protein [Sphingomonas donggukensis]URW75746.1 DUF4893 domain-containing protein [Sphingomonas donggukensis]
MRHVICASLLLCPLTACMMQPAAPKRAIVAVEPGEPWRETASAEDALRIDGLPATWTRVLARLPARSRKEATAEGPLLTADAALDHPELPPGSYSCRVLRLGDGAGPLRLRAFKPNFCYVGAAGDRTLTLSKQTGSDLPAGRLHPYGDKRYVFLGANQRKAGDTSLAYATDRTRDVGGVIERVAPFRWRLVVPSRDERTLDVYELTPVPVERQPG